MADSLDITSSLRFDSAETRNAFRRRIRRWFRTNARDLPWRHTNDPYAIWVSEIMLQQTQVATVIPYWERFLKSFPNVKKLAAADESKVLKLWEGLGYYRRARQLHRAAQVVVQEHGGRFPTKYQEVLALPGIGRYTAGAILSISSDQAYPVLEGNTIRVYSRLDGYTEDVTSGPGQKHLWEFAEQLVTRSHPGELNQALMELGSEICTPRDPDCTNCPVRMHCRAFSDGNPEFYPVNKRAIQYEARRETAVVIEHNDRVLMREYSGRERWAGLWDFPRFETPGAADKDSESGAIEATVQEATGLQVAIGAPFWKTKHAVTKYRIELTCYRSRSSLSNKQLNQIRAPYQWTHLSDLAELPLNVTGRMIAERL